MRKTRVQIRPWALRCEKPTVNEHRTSKRSIPSGIERSHNPAIIPAIKPRLGNTCRRYASSKELVQPMWRLEPQEIREKYPKRRVHHQSFNLLRVLERRAEKGKVKSHVDDLKNKTNGAVRGQNGMTSLKKRPSIPTYVFLPPLVFAKMTKLRSMWKSDGEAQKLTCD